jgi:integrase
LSKQALAVLDVATRFDGDFVTGAGKPFTSFSDLKKDVDGLTSPPVAGWRLHDLRRTCASGMARLGIPPYIVEHTLGHQKSGSLRGVAGVYQRYDYQAEKTEALARWGAHVEALVGGTPSGRRRHLQVVAA